MCVKYKMFSYDADIFNQNAEKYATNMKKIRENTYSIAAYATDFSNRIRDDENSTTQDVRKRDIKQLMDQEDIMYYTGMIAACSLLVAAFVLVAKRV